MNPIASQQVEEDDVFSIPLSAEDIDANTSVNFDIMDGVCTICTDNIYDYAEFTYSITLYDDYGAGIVSTNATSNVNEITDDLTITPIDDFTGDIVVEVFATDNDTTQDGSLDSEPITFILTVNNKNDAPVIYPINEQFFDEDEFDIVEIDFTASDLDYDELFFSVEFESNGITDTDPFFIDGVSFDYNWDPDVFITEAALLLDIYENYNHDIIVTITVYDNLSIAYNHDGIEVPSEDSESFTITITPVNDAPHCYGISMSGHNNIQFKEDGRMFEGDPQQDDMGNIVVGTEITNATNTIQVDLLNYESSEGYSFIVLDIDSNELINKNAYDLNSLTFYVDTQPTKTLDGIPTQIGSIEFINNSSTMDWTPMANFNGWLDFLYYVQDEEYLSTPKTIAFYIGSVNDPVEPFELVSAIQDYAENAGVVSPYDDDYYIKFPNYEIDNVPLFIDDIDSSNVIEYYNYLDGNPYNEGTVTFKWERSSDVDTDQPINHSNEYLRYRLELIDELNEKVYIIKNQIRDAYIGPWDYTYCDDVNDIDYCSLTLTLNEGPYDTYNLNDRLNYDDVTINTENLIIDGTVEYKWRVSAYDWAGVTGYEQLVFPRFLSSEPYINTLTKSSIDDYYVDFTQPGFDYSFILNNIYNNYFDLYVQADETVEFNDSLYFAYIDTTIIEEESDGIISQIIEIENTYLNADIFSVYDKFNAYGLINTYFAGQDVSGNINIDKKEFTFNTIPYNSVNHYNSPSGLMRVIISNNSNSTNSNILLHEENNFNHEDIISQTVLINSNINIDESEIKIEFDRENIENIHHSHFNNIHIARVYDNHVELIPTYNDGNTIYAYLEDLGSFALILNEFSTYEVPYETKIVSSYPNPFNPTVTIDYTLEKDSFVEINVFNILGQKITQLHRGSQFRGDNKVVWNGKNLSGHKVSSGTYFVHIKNENNFLIEKVTLVK